MVGITIVFGAMGGENTKKSPYLLDAQREAQRVENVDFLTGKGTPYKGLSVIKNAKTKTRGIAYFDSDTLEFPYAADTTLVGRGQKKPGERLIISNVADGSTAAGAAVYAKKPRRKYPSSVDSPDDNIYFLESPMPTVAPVAAKTQTSSSSGDVITAVYAFAWRANDGTESKLGPTKSIEAKAGDEITFTFPRNWAGVKPPDISIDRDKKQDDGAIYEVFGGKVVLYRALDAGYFEIREFDGVTAPPAGVSAFTDDVGVAATGVAAQFVAEVETRPRDGLRGVAWHPKGFLFGFVENRLCFSAVEQYGVWPQSYEIVFPAGDIIAAVPHAGDIYVFCDSAPPQVVRLDSPQNVALPVPFEIDFPCVAGGSVRSVGRQVLYAAREGIVSLPQGELITRGIYSERGREKFSPPQQAFSLAGEYYGVRSEDVLYLTTRGVSALDAGRITVAGITASAKDDDGNVYVLADGKIGLWGSGENLTMKWVSAPIKYFDLGHAPVVWVFASEATRHNVLESVGKVDILGEDADYAYFGADYYAGDFYHVPPKVINIEEAAGFIEIKLRTENDEEVINLPGDNDPRDAFHGSGCDCAIWTRQLDLSVFVQITLLADREVQFVGLFPAMRDLEDMKLRSGILPPPGVGGG